MREKEYTPLLVNGFKEIGEVDLKNEFVSPFDFQAKEYRNNLVISFISFLKEFKTINIAAEVWIDGSFTTEAPNPSDVDVVFYFNPIEIDSLEGERKEKFQRLFTERKFMLNLYKVEVHYATRGNDLDYKQWQRTFGTCYDNVTPKGIFRITYN